MRRTRLARAALLLGLALGATACTGEESEDSGTAAEETDTPTDAPTGAEPTEDGSSDEDPDDAPGEEDDGVSADAPPVRANVEEGQRVRQADYGVHTLGLPTDSPAREAAEGFVAYLDARTRAFNTGVADPVALSSTAMGDALSSVQSYTTDLTSRGARTVGDTWITITDDQVSVRGRTAQLRGFCVQNASVDVDAQGIALESPPDAYRIDASVRRVGPDAWLAQSFTATAVAAC